MKTLLILRHAKSSWKHAELADHARPLKRRGERAAPRMGELLIEKELIPQLIISSTAKRALKTTELVAEACQYNGEVQPEHGLYGAGHMGCILILRGVPDVYQRVMIVGHNPGLEVLLEVLTRETVWLPTAALAHVELPIDTWAEIRENIGGKLVDLWEPKTLPPTLG